MQFLFSPYNGGQGVSLACTTSTGRVLLVGDYGALEDVSVAVIVNTGSNWAFVQFGDVTVTATTGSMGVPPGGALTVTIPGAQNGVAMYLAGITSTSTTTLQITTGFGN